MEKMPIWDKKVSYYHHWGMKIGDDWTTEKQTLFAYLKKKQGKHRNDGTIWLIKKGAFKI